MALDEGGQVCRVERFKRDWQRTIDSIVAATGSAVALVDATHGAVGDPILTWLQQDGPEGHFLPFEFTAQTRETLLVELAATMQRGEVCLPRDGHLRSELEALEWQATASHVWRYGISAGDVWRSRHGPGARDPAAHAVVHLATRAGRDASRG